MLDLYKKEKKNMQSLKTTQYNLYLMAKYIDQNVVKNEDNIERCV